MIGVQWLNDPQDATRAKGRGIMVIDANILDVTWPTADVYYCFTFTHDMKRVLAKHQRGVLIIGGTPEKFKNYPEQVRQGLMIDIPTTDHDEPLWRIAIFDKRPKP